jgi:hypothetical protein
MTADKDELAALRKRVEELEAKTKPPEPKPEFKEQPFRRYDPTEGMRMPPSALAAMAGHPCNQVMPGVIRDRHAPNSPGMTPSSQQTSGGGPVNKSGWVDAAPISSPPGLRYVDAQLDAQDARDRAELARKLGK